MAGIEYPQRQVVDLSHGWQFVRRRARRAWLSGADADGDAVNLPHCWNAQDAFQQNVVYYRGPGSYRKRLGGALPPPGPTRTILRSEGFYGLAELWINGCRICKLDGQYLGFGHDITPYLQREGSDILGVRLTNRCPRHVLPGIAMPDFLLYGGLSGRMWLEQRPEVHLDIPRTHVLPHGNMGGGWAVDICTTVCNTGAEKAHTELTWILLDAAGRHIAETPVNSCRITAGGYGVVQMRMEVPDAQAWSPEHPVLYTLEGTLSIDGRVNDGARLRIGFRVAEFRPDEGFFLNGTRLALRGCNRHESMPGFGRALPVSMHRRDARQIRDMGLNFVRLSHYPEHPAFLDACDELGLLVYAEIATWKSVRGYGRWLGAACRQMQAMIRRDRHRPCIVTWGMGNESQSRRAYRHLRKVIRAEDASRPATYAENHMYRARRKRTLGLSDVWSVNYELDAMAEGRDSCPTRTVIISECSNEPDSRRGDMGAEVRQVETLARDLARIEAEAFVAGFALWCFNDYATLRKQRYFRYSGVVDAWRQPKLAASFLRARYVQTPLVDLLADWEERSDGQDRRRVHIVTNCETIRVLSNETELMTQPGRPYMTLEVPFRPGCLLVRGERGGEQAEASMTSWARAVVIRAARDPRPQPQGQADDVRSFTISIEDAAGRLVRSWHGQIEAHVEGDGYLHSYTPDGHIMMGGGRGRCFVSRTSSRGAVLVVTGGGLAPAKEAF